MNQANQSHLRQFIPMNRLSENHLNELVPAAHILTVPVGKKIFKRGEKPKYNFYLMDGTVDLCDEQFNITTIKAGTNEALYSLDDHKPLQCSAVTTKPCHILAVNKDKLDLVLTWNQAGSYLVSELGSETEEIEEEHNEADWMSSLLQSNLFQNIPPSNIQQLFCKFKPVEVKNHQVIVNEGEHGYLFYVIESGRAKVQKINIQGQNETIAYLNPGQFFGQEALVGDITRNATVVMESDGCLMKLDKNDFRTLLQQPILNYVTVSDMAELTQTGHKVERIDVRLPMEFNRERVNGCTNIPLSDLRTRFVSLNPDITYVISCDGGRRSELGAYLLNEAGFHAFVFKQQMS